MNITLGLTGSDNGTGQGRETTTKTFESVIHVSITSVSGTAFINTITVLRAGMLPATMAVGDTHRELGLITGITVERIT